nr:Plus-3 domain, subgroup protein [Ipomoea batatas]GME10694.1 Plus-3 domain, subgroup protein [Ipomoea batatas]
MFKKKTVLRKNAYHLLEVHFRENHVDDDDVDNATEKSCFAAISAPNIKLIFLRLQFVKGLLKENPEMFEDNVVGCIVRIHSNSKKHSYQLHQVIGVIQSSGEPNLRLSNVEVEVPMSELSDRYFTEEEFESKAQSLHRFLTKNKPVEAELEETPSSVSAEQKEKPPGRSDKTEGGEEEKEQKPVNQEPIVTGYEADHVEAPEGTSEEENVLMSQPNAVAEEPEPEPTLMDTSVTEEQAERRAEEENNVANAVAEEPEPEPPLMSASTPLDDIQREAQARANYTRRILRAACELSAAGTAPEDPTAVIWLGADHRGYIEGPVSLNHLRIWLQQGYLGPDFRVWKTGQDQSQSVLLSHLLNS